MPTISRVILLIVSVGFFITRSAEIQKTNSIQQMLLQRKVGNEPLYEVESLLKFYEQRTGESNWKPSQAEEMIHAIETARTRGLNPDDYHWKAITVLNRNSTKTNNVSIEQDLLLSDAFLRLAHHLANGKVKPSAYWKLQRPQINTLDLLTEALGSNKISSVLYSVEPQNVAYQILIETLREYRQMESNGGWEKVSDAQTLQGKQR